MVTHLTHTWAESLNGKNMLLFYYGNTASNILLLQHEQFKRDIFISISSISIQLWSWQTNNRKPQFIPSNTIFC